MVVTFVEIPPLVGCTRPMTKVELLRALITIVGESQTEKRAGLPVSTILSLALSTRAFLPFPLAKEAAAAAAWQHNY